MSEIQLVISGISRALAYRAVKASLCRPSRFLGSPRKGTATGAVRNILLHGARKVMSRLD